MSTKPAANVDLTWLEGSLNFEQRLEVIGFGDDGNLWHAWQIDGAPNWSFIGRQTAVQWYPSHMSRETQALLEAFEHLPAEEKRAFTDEVLRRSLPFDSGPLADEEIGDASDALWQSLDEEDDDPAAR